MTRYEFWMLLATVLTPVAILVATVWLGIQGRRLTQRQEKFSELVAKRVALWDKLALPLNDLYAYYLFVGNWKELSERDVIAAKRACDKVVYAYRPFFSARFFDAYTKLMDEAFVPFGRAGQDARLRTVHIRPRDQDHAADRFTGEDNSRAVHEAYFSLLTVAASEFDLVLDAPVAPNVPRSRADISD